jgi:spore coat polysaccharide biosynthesis protein SpsF (cytidylyltransferase family)
VRPVAIVQSRMGSTRLPGKALADVAGEPLLVRVVERARRAGRLADVVVATSADPGDAPIRALCADRGIPCFAGSESDVLDRFHGAAEAHGADPVVRLTGDCPLLDPALVDAVVDLYATGEHDHVGVAAGAGASRLDGGRYPSGVDAECFSRAALDRAWREATAASDREHVTPYLWRVPGRFRVGSIRGDRDLGHLHWSVDTGADLSFVRTVYDRLGPTFGLEDVLALLRRDPELAAACAGGSVAEHTRIWAAA